VTDNDREMERRLVHVARLTVLIVCVATPLAVARTSSAAQSSDSIPLIADGPSYTAERDMPAAVRQRLGKDALQALLLLRRGSRQTPSLAAGCRPNDFSTLGSPTPTVRSVIFGRHVEVVVRFADMPASLACRPWTVLISTTGSTSTPWAQTYQLRGPAGRAVIMLPPYAKAPFTLGVTAGTMQGRTSKRIQQSLECPPGGCLVRAFPLRNMTRAQLEASFVAALDALARAAPYMKHAARCPGLTVCEVTYVDPLYPNQPYVSRYEIGGEQTPGCWLVRTTRRLTTPPYEDIFAGAPEAGCVTWPI
jgi:hypothetical protein